MADDAKKPSIDSEKAADFIDTAIKRLKRCVDAEDHNRVQSIDDLKFVYLEKSQWDEDEKKRRNDSKRPCLTVNQLKKYIKQVVGDQRQNRTQIKVRPVDSDADVHVAKVLEGIISDIEYQSNADAIYDYACKMITSCAYGAWRILTRYTEDNPFLQEIYMERLPNPHAAYLDPDSKSEVYADAKYGFILEKWRREDFEKEWPDADLPSEELKIGKGMSNELWYDKETVIVADYYVREEVKRTMCLMADGEVLPQDEADAKVKEWNDIAAAILQADPLAPPPPDKPEIKKSRAVSSHKIKYYTICANGCLNEHDEDGEPFPGKYIPIIVVRGDDVNVEGKTYVESLIRDAKDPQKLHNYWVTAAAERVALEPKAPWLMSEEQIEGYEEDYAKANTDNVPVLLYNFKENQPQPQRQGPGQAPAALFTEIENSRRSIQETIGMFNADIGEQGREISGKALLQRQKPGDAGTFVFIDNLNRAIAHSGRVICSMIPEVYDSERDVRLRNFDDTETFAPVNGTVGDAIKKMKLDPARYAGMEKTYIEKLAKTKGRSAILHDLSRGKYNVVIKSGPSYATRRQESADQLFKLYSADPNRLGLALDLIVKNLDILDAEELSSRLRKPLLAQGIIKPKEGEELGKPPTPAPAVILQMEKIKQAVTAQKVNYVKLLKELQGTDQEVKKTVLEVLAELHAPQHPADQILQGGM